MEKRYLKIILSLFAFIVPFSAWASASLSISPSSGTYHVGQTFTVSVKANSDAPFNAISLSLLFPPPIFSLVSVSSTDSILTFWVTEPTISKGDGTLTLEGVTPGGVKGLSGTVVRATVRANEVGTGSVSFHSGQVLANDGNGTDITGTMAGAKYTVIAAKPVTSTTPPPAAPSTPSPISVTPQPEFPTTSATSVQLAPTLSPPEISLGSKYGAPAIIGSSQYPNAQVLLTFVSSEGSKVFITGNADSDGSFTLLVPSSLRSGAYSVTARMIKLDGTNSPDSNSISIFVGGIFSDLSWQMKWMFFLLLLAILYLIIRIMMHLRDDRTRRRAIRKEAREAESILHDTMDNLRGNIKNEGGGVDVTKEINDAEEKIKKEIEDIDAV